MRDCGSQPRLDRICRYFLWAARCLGVGHGEEVYPLPDLPATVCVVATPEIGVSTPQAFADWDGMTVGATGKTAELRSARTGRRSVPARSGDGAKLTPQSPSDRMIEFGRMFSAWLSSQPLSGVPVSKGRGRAETSLLDLVRTGIENDFEQVVFPKYPELREVKSVLERAGAIYASLSGSGSALYGLFRSRAAAAKAVARLRKRWHSGGGHDDDDPAAVLEKDFRLSFSSQIDCGRNVAFQSTI